MNGLGWIVDDRECPRCGLVFLSNYHLVRHAEKKVVCLPIKSNTVLLPDKLVRKTDHNISVIEKEWSCSQCFKKFSSRSSRDRHKRQTCVVKSTI